MENITAYLNDQFLRDLAPYEYSSAIHDIAGFYEVQSHWGVFYGDANFGTTLN